MFPRFFFVLCDAIVHWLRVREWGAGHAADYKHTPAPESHVHSAVIAPTAVKKPVISMAPTTSDHEGRIAFGSNARKLVAAEAAMMKANVVPSTGQPLKISRRGGASVLHQCFFAADFGEERGG